MEEQSIMIRKIHRRRFLYCSSLGLAGIACVDLGHAFEASSLSEQARKWLAGITWFKQSGFRLQDGDRVMYIDPYEITISPHDADVLLISHSHNDHCHTASVSRVAKETTIALTEPESAAKIKNLIQDIRTATPGETLTVGGFKIETVPSYNINKTNHPKSKNYLGFVVTLQDGRRIYHAGDTDHIPEMEAIDCDVALLPCGGTYTMNTTEAAAAAKIIQPGIVVPMHYGSVVGSPQDGQTLKKLLEGAIETVVFEPGQSVEPFNAHIKEWKSQ